MYNIHTHTHTHRYKYVMYKHLSSEILVPEDCFLAMTIRASSAAKTAAATVYIYK